MLLMATRSLEYCPTQMSDTELLEGLEVTNMEKINNK
jgi:hypothetical protein